jgi:SAM-dependent methyltransferase
MTIGYSKEWDRAFEANTHISLWPWSDLVSYVHRYAKPDSGYRRVLELGCGVGANIPLFLKLGVDYAAIEGSEAAVRRLHQAYPELADRIIVGDFTQAIPFRGPFDLIVDRSAITHNTTEAISRALGMAFDLLRSGGKLLGINWFSTDHPDAQSGNALDSHTKTDLTTGQFAGIGAVHFSDKDHIVGLLTAAGFILDRLEHKRTEIVVPTSTGPLGWWNFVAVKP